MTSWRVELLGDTFDLEELPNLFDAPDLRVVQDSGQFYLEGPKFDSLPDPDSIRAAARDVIQTINGLARLVYSNFKPVTVGTLVRIDQTGSTHFILAEGDLELRAKSSIAVAILGDVSPAPTERPPRPATKWLSTAQSFEPARRALRMLARPTVAWSDLHKVIEIVQKHGGSTLVGEVVTRADIDRITQTANSRDAIGDDARHGHDDFKAPKKLLSLEEARAIVHRLVRAWLERE